MAGGLHRACCCLLCSPWATRDFQPSNNCGGPHVPGSSIRVGTFPPEEVGQYIFMRLAGTWPKNGSAAGTRILTTGPKVVVRCPSAEAASCVAVAPIETTGYLAIQAYELHNAPLDLVVGTKMPPFDLVTECLPSGTFETIGSPNDLCKLKGKTFRAAAFWSGYDAIPPCAGQPGPYAVPVFALDSRLEQYPVATFFKANWKDWKVRMTVAAEYASTDNGTTQKINYLHPRFIQGFGVETVPVQRPPYVGHVPCVTQTATLTHEFAFSGPVSGRTFDDLALYRDSLNVNSDPSTIPLSLTFTSFECTDPQGNIVPVDCPGDTDGPGGGAKPWDTSQPSRGLGDTIAKVTSAVGIKPCGGCKKRQGKLNEWWPYGGQR